MGSRARKLSICHCIHGEWNCYYDTYSAPGEDPFVTSSYARNFIRGMQGYFDNNKYLKTSSCPKHYADYSLEDADGVTRHTFNAIVSDYDQNDTYLVPFKYAVIDANASGIMCSYNED